MGGYGDNNAWQIVNLGAGIFATGAFWNNYYFIATPQNGLAAYQLNPATAKLTSTPVSASSSPSGGFPWPGSSPAISSSGSTNGIAWAIDSSRYCTNKSSACGSAVVHAYNATNLANELWNSSMAAGGADAAGNAVKFTVPTVANGKLYVGTRGNNTGGAYGSTSVSGELDVYGLKP